MLSLRLIVSVAAVMAVLVVESISHNRQLIEMRRNSAYNYRDAYRYPILNRDDCTDEKCDDGMYDDRDISIQSSNMLPSRTDFAPNEEMSEFWSEFIDNDSKKKENPFDIHSELDAPINLKSLRNNAFKNVKPSKCSCLVEWSVRSFGPYHYPREINEAKCASIYCDSLPYVCKENVLKILVLKIKDGNEISPIVLPDDLKEKYVLRYFNVSVGCECTIL